MAIASLREMFGVVVSGWRRVRFHKDGRRPDRNWVAFVPDGPDRVKRLPLTAPTKSEARAALKRLLGLTTSAGLPVQAAR